MKPTDRVPIIFDTELTYLLGLIFIFDARSPILEFDIFSELKSTSHDVRHILRLQSLCSALYERKDTLQLGAITIDDSSFSENYDCSIILHKYSPTKSQHYV